MGKKKKKSGKDRTRFKLKRTDAIRSIIETDNTFKLIDDLWVGKCIHCGTKLVVVDGTWCTSATIEHIMPICAGGDDDVRNIALACSNCNSEKGVRHDQKNLDARAKTIIAKLKAIRLIDRWRDGPDGNIVT
jgi:5-methylcytosine-specific restriction endonuclease McrA